MERLLKSYLLLAVCGIEARSELYFKVAKSDALLGTIFLTTKRPSYRLEPPRPDG
ncbi:MAG: hypothetical protein M3N26_09090 [Pseudomonadota bacterium]|nr:hypothetical protein [Pseudomonadota bacterium]